MKNLLIRLAVFILALGMAGFVAAEPKVMGKTVEYSTQGVVMKGYLAYDESIQGKRPGVLVVHEWWGLNDYVRRRARMLAELGYTALAMDMYGGGKQAMHPDDANAFSSELMKNFDSAKARFMAGMEFLKQQAIISGQPPQRGLSFVKVWSGDHPYTKC
jgi:hypothetical protein